MPESALTLLKFLFLALIYLFLWFVVRVVLRELRAPALAAAGVTAGAPARARAARPKTFATLRVVAPEHRVGELVAIDDEITVGRGGGCALVLADDQFASTVHARVFRRGNDLWVDDLGSRNGTFVNGHRVTATTRLKKNDRVQFGQTVCDVLR
ncbi:MAG: FHA domain-containing protein [Actinomycetota bacterium]